MSTTNTKKTAKQLMVDASHELQIRLTDNGFEDAARQIQSAVDESIEKAQGMPAPSRRIFFSNNTEVLLGSARKLDLVFDATQDPRDRGENVEEITGRSIEALGINHAARIDALSRRNEHNSRGLI